MVCVCREGGQRILLNHFVNLHPLRYSHGNGSLGHRKQMQIHIEVRRQGWMERCWGAGGRDGTGREGSGEAQQLAPFFPPFFLSLSPAAVPVSPIWWKSNSTLALIMWQLEFTYLVNPASGFGFQLVSLWLLCSPRGWWEQDGGGGACCVGWERIQYDGEGGGRGSHT